jgi:RND family efflux transporter MFP subunit
MTRRTFALLVPPLLSLLAACAAASAAEPPEVTVATPAVREVTDHAEFAGRVEAAAVVEVRPRVSGYLDKVHFRDGAEVKKGELLFEIDPRPYEAELAKATAALAVAEARLQRAEAELKRAKALMTRQAMSQEEYDRILADRSEAEAGVVLAKAALAQARLTLGFTKVTSPMDGRVGRRQLDPGNLVRGDETLLATVVAVKPARVAFEVDEKTWLRLVRLAREGKAKPAEAGLPVEVGLADEDSFPHKGRLDFVDTRLDPKTGTLPARVVLEDGDGLLPGRFARVRLAVGEPYKALLVPEEAVATEGGGASVLVVGDKGVVELREVVLGSRQGKSRVVSRGLGEDDRVVVGGPKGLRPGTAVKVVKVVKTPSP